MEHCLSVAGIPLTPLVKKVLTMKRERKMFGHMPIWKIFIVIRILAFINYWSILEPEEKSSENCLLRLWKVCPNGKN